MLDWLIGCLPRRPVFDAPIRDDSVTRAIRRAAEARILLLLRRRRACDVSTTGFPDIAMARYLNSAASVVAAPPPGAQGAEAEARDSEDPP